ncbi:uncharacterized protein [Panulirus ornatus]|uniref:uncharacterized protein isoform X2 n=1 Tax=Panulirus ornatus TaxID=150431 RepID=UPI003A86F0D7
MVHRKSTYRLMFKNYGSEVRKNVWRENNSLRLRRREEEMSHHSIEESDSDCICDDSDEEEERPELAVRQGTSNLAGTKGILSRSDEQIQQQPSIQAGEREPPPHIPRLHFTPEQSPRASRQQSTPNDLDVNLSRDGTSEQFDDKRGSMPNLNLTRDTVESQNIGVEPRSKPMPSADQIGVMRSGSRTREYDLIPGDSNIHTRGTTLTKSRLMKSHKYPLTTRLSRTTQRNFQERDKINYVPFGTGTSVNTIGDKTSFNIHLSKDQVRPTALQASSLRNREIERLMKKQKKMTLNDWRGKGEGGQLINHSSLWADAKKQIFSSRSRPRERVVSAPSRVEVFSNYCKHCGGRR